MTRALTRIVPLVIILFSTLAPLRADTCNGFSNNLVSNCSFETGTFTGWSGTATTSLATGVDTLSPYAGSYEAYLGSVLSTVALTQTLSTTSGTSYLIKFALLDDTNPSVGYTNSFSLQFGGTTLFSESRRQRRPVQAVLFRRNGNLRFHQPLLRISKRRRRLRSRLGQRHSPRP